MTKSFKVKNPAQADAALAELFEELGDKVDEVKEDLFEGLVEGANVIFEKSQVEVPVRSGKLRRSGYIEEDKDNLTVEVGYDRGGEAPYATIVHEDLEAKHAEPTKAKYLEDPLKQSMEEVTAAVMKKLRGGVK